MPDDDLVRAGGSMWLDALLYDSGQREDELLIADERTGWRTTPRDPGDDPAAVVAVLLGQGTASTGREEF